MKNLKNSKAITLVALVVTIVILLILAGISISALTNTGIFQKAKDAKGVSENAEKEQNKILDEYETQLDQYNENTLVYKVNNGTVKIGDYVSYTPDEASTDGILDELGKYSGATENKSSTLSQETLNWRVLDVKDGHVRLISATPTTQENNRVYLGGVKGYNNAVYLLDKICKTLYSNFNLASDVKNLKIEDIQDHLSYDYKTYINSNVDTGKYGGTREYTTNKNYPNIFAKEKNGWVDEKKGIELDLSEQIDSINATKTEANEKIKIKQTFWNKTVTQSDFYDGYYELFIKNESGNYWISSRCVNALSDSASFRVRCVNSGSVDATTMYQSYGGEFYNNFAYRPVVTLKSNVQLDPTHNGDGTSPEQAYVIK